MTDQDSIARVGYFEEKQSFADLPAWVRWFIGLGLKYPVSGFGITGRTVLLVSTPCDFPAAGLISIGIVMRDLARAGASDEQSHAEAVRSWARQYVDWCKSCKLKCQPKIKNCGFSEESLGEILETPDNPGKNRVRFQVDSLGNDGILTLKEAPRKNSQNAPVMMRFGPGSNPDAMLSKFVPDGWPAPTTPPNRPPMSAGSFSTLSPDWMPSHQNLTQSYSGACLVGRQQGNTETKEVLEGSGFTFNSVRCGLSAMLSIESWGEDSVSRLRFYNTRRGSVGFDRQGMMPEIAVVDGARELVEVLSKPQDFGRTNVIGVVSRDVDSDHIERLSTACNEYLAGFQAIDFLPDTPPPPGVSIRWLRAP